MFFLQRIVTQQKERNLILTESEEKAGEEEPEPEDLTVEAEQHPESHVGYVRPVKYLEVTVPPAI